MSFQLTLSVNQRADDRHYRDTVKLEDQSAKKEIIELSYNEEYKIKVLIYPRSILILKPHREAKKISRVLRGCEMLLEELKEEGVDGVVVDLRNNGGGSLGEANQLVGLFIETSATVQIRYSGMRNGFTRPWDNDPEVAYGFWQFL